MSNIQSLRGMKDIIDEDSKLFSYFIENASKIAQNYGFSYISTPLLEETALFRRSVGESSDIVNKEMYQFIDKGQNDVCLRPEGTAGVVRCFIQNKFDKAGVNKKWFYYGPMFRYERPQKGRLRQFHQFGVESFGEKSVYEDVNMIMMIKDIFDFFKIEYKLLINSLGCDECMPPYKQNLVNKLESLKESLCGDCNRRIITNPIRVLDCKIDSCKELLKDMPKITHSLCDSCNKDFELLKEVLTQNNISFEIDSNLVRGLDYYNKTAFEFVSTQIGSQNAMAGGGRYDKLVEYLNGKSTPAVGFAIGIERILELIKYQEKDEDIYYFGTMLQDGVDLIVLKAYDFRKKYKAIVEYSPKSFIKHLNSADKQGANIVVLIGEDEIKNSTVFIKNLKTKEEKSILYKELS
ncbi:MAG: histidine--tRNA ligase [Arcobacteraceae bacterium]|jgi:histidyl-tRNA synthetase|nr:histidine--tRNA ligase [Arcobacteraceae bacterium]MDY0365845.1 histidine--tRNA ligase [Arcobacteraceae bacterium]